MKNRILEYSFLAFFAVVLISLGVTTNGCMHDPFFPDDIMPIDTTDMPIDSTDMPIDTMGIPCDSDKVYFAREILPILNSNCALSGCHDAASAQKDVILSDYDNVIETADVRAFDLSGSDLYKVLVENDADKQMPPPPKERLKASEVQLIAKWILQGATNDSCDQNIVCETEAMSFQNNIFPILDTNCKGCHGSAAPNGGVVLDNYGGIKIVSDNGRLRGAITHAGGFTPMPQNQSKLRQCDIDQIVAWIEQGVKNN